MDLELGGIQHVVEAGSAVHIPAGTPHRNEYPHPGVERHLEILVPPPPRGTPVLRKVDPDDERGAGRGQVLPASEARTKEMVHWAKALRSRWGPP
jgi:hypothetical protein